MAHNDLYHEGELEVQARAGVAQAARMTAAAIQDHIPANAMPFIEQQAMAVFGSLDAKGNVWASVLFGRPGFLTCRGRSDAALATEILPRRRRRSPVEEPRQ